MGVVLLRLLRATLFALVAARVKRFDSPEAADAEYASPQQEMLMVLVPHPGSDTPRRLHAETAKIWANVSFALAPVHEWGSNSRLTTDLLTMVGAKTVDDLPAHALLLRGEPPDLIPHRGGWGPEDLGDFLRGQFEFSARQQRVAALRCGYEPARVALGLAARRGGLGRRRERRPIRRADHP